MDDLIEQLTAVEARLTRCLADGWRASRDDVPRLRADAARFAEIGLTAFAVRLIEVADAGSAGEALRASSLAMASSRLLRLRLSGNDVDDGWGPWIVPRKGRGADRETLLPIGLLSLGDRIVWSCLRSRGFAVEWTLIEGVVGSRDETGNPPWLRQTISGHLRWRARYPVGANREVQVSALDVGTVERPASGNDPFAALTRRLLPGKLKDDKLPAWGGGSIRLQPLERDEIDGRVWLDPAVKAELETLTSDRLWAVVYDPGDIAVVIGALAERGRLIKRLEAAHLIAGLPMEALGDPPR